MTWNTLCPDSTALAAFALGRIAEPTAWEVEAHLAGCPTCVRALAGVEAADPLLDAVRAGAGMPDDPDGGRWVERFLHLPSELFGSTATPPVGSQSSTADLAASADSQSAVSGDAAFAVLTPPAGPGEVGRLGPYRVLGLLGEGGMGAVFRAEDPALARPVALKVMLPRAAAAPGAGERFLREARAAAAVRHDHVVTIYQVGEDRGVPFIAMELLSGESLADRLKRTGRLDPAAAARVGRQAAEGLAAAHARGLVHRDVKPENLWLEDPTDRVKVLDFGLVRGASDGPKTRSGAVVGTPAYMAPEQARSGRAVDHRADLFGLGCVLYRAVTGTAPFRGADVISTLMAVATETPPPPHRVRPDVPRELSDLVMQLLAKEPDRRPASAADVAGRLADLETRASAPVRRRLRHAVGVAAALLGVAVVACSCGWVIVRDKDGNEVGRQQVPAGGSVTVAPDAPNAVPAVGPEPTERAATRPIPPAPAPPAPVSEPPPLAEWLTGRTELTVSQDGKGQFKTIQAALDALKPGQVVRVLDRGPYRERLRIGMVPADTGLIGTGETTVELPDWPEDRPEGHEFDPTDGFRLAGVAFVGPNRRTWGALVIFHRPSGLVAESCLFGAVPRPDEPKVIGLHIPALDADRGTRQVTVRDCLFSGTKLQFADAGAPLRGPVLVERNYFRAAGVVTGCPRLDTLVVRNNVFDAPVPRFNGVWVPGLDAVDGVLELSGNTFVCGSLIFVDKVPIGRVVVRNNLGAIGPMFAPDRAAWEAGRERAARWQVGNNGFLHPGHLPRVPGDVAVDPGYLSTDPASRDYLRVPAGGPHSAGGAWPGYIGALQPGPAPKDGDWFTRLRDKWAAFVTKPISIPEPPPVAEWLKGRTELTVSQDGKGQFKTIQAALDALKPGQVIRILDRGPYREQLVLDPVPDDTGLVTDQRTVIELANWTAHTPPGGATGHRFGATEGFRIHGFAFVFPNPPREGVGLRARTRPSGFVLENCFVDASPGNELGSAVQFNWSAEVESRPVWVRDCWFRGQLMFVSGNPRAAAVVERNLLNGHGNQCLGFAYQFATVVVRRNILSGPVRSGDLKFVELPPAVALEVSNNTLAAVVPPCFLTTAPEQTVTFRNNLRIRPGLIVRYDGAEQGERNWDVGHNAYPRKLWNLELKLPGERQVSGASDVLAEPDLLSSDPAHPDAFRPATGSRLGVSGTGGAWPAYIGALPPGPAPEDGDWFTRLRDRWAE